MKKLFSVMIALALLISLAACGAPSNVDPDATTSSNPEANNLSLPDPAANVDPDNMDWGWHDYDENLPSGTSDMWYPIEKGDSSNEYLYFMNGRGIHKGIGEDESSSSWTVTDDLHIVVDPEYAEYSEFDYDIVFMDNFILFDYVSGKYYSRGDQEKYNALYSGKTFTHDENRYIEFHDDGSATYFYNGEGENCEWEVLAQKIAVLKYSDGYVGNYYTFFNDDGSVNYFCEDPMNVDTAFYAG